VRPPGTRGLNPRYGVVENLGLVRRAPLPRRDLAGRFARRRPDRRLPSPSSASNDDLDRPLERQAPAQGRRRYFRNCRVNPRKSFPVAASARPAGGRACAPEKYREPPHRTNDVDKMV